MAVAFDTLIEFILMNHGVIPAKLAEVIAERQEQRIIASLPKQADATAEVARVGDSVSTVLGRSGTVVGPASQAGQILKMQGGTVGWAPAPTAKQVRDSLIADMLKHTSGV